VGGLVAGVAVGAVLAAGGTLVMSRWDGTLAQNKLISIARDSEGELLPGVTVTVQYVQSSGKLVTAQTTMTDADGVYEVVRPVGHYLITAMYNDSSTGQKRTLVLMNEEGPFTIGQTRIIGIARDSEGKVLSGVTVRLQSVSASGALSTTQTTTTDANGRYEVCATSSKYLVTAQYNDRSTGQTRTISLRSHLGSQTRMGGIALDLNGNVLAGVTVVVQAVRGSSQLTTVQTTTTDANGKYEITRPSGSYLVTAQYTDRSTGERRTVMLVPRALE
jgi:5-hydroxyisourate hydrolase-like protein (transthyretin family)